VTYVNGTHRFDLQMSEGGWDASDHVSFNTAGVPVLFLFTGPHPQYHSVDDTWDLITEPGLQRVSEFAWDFAERIMLLPDPLVYKAVTNLSSGAAPARGKKRAWLGTIPDFVDDVDGVRLSGVMPNSPAEEAGLIKGDVVTAIGEVVITNLSDLTVALQTHGEGQMVNVRFVRQDEERILPVTLRPRPR
jgi:membrane-associated protease RseP (regulator of RpoE activity)